MTEEIERIPLKNLPPSGLIVWRYEPWKEGDPTRPNNVLISCIDSLEKVSLVGRTIDGQMYYASSTDNAREIIKDLEDFKGFLSTYEDLYGRDD